MIRFLAGTIVLLSAGGALGADPTVVTIGMSNATDGSQFMTLSRGSVRAGPVVFKVMNQSTNIVHEFLVVRTSLDPNAFPMMADGSKVDESQLKGVTELGDLAPGKAGDMSMIFEPGRYVLFCNQPGNFRAGMFAVLVATP